MKVSSQFFSLVSGSAVALTLVGAGVPPPYRVVDRKIILDSPFALQIGSTEYAEAFGDRIRTNASATYDPETKVTKTNFYHYANARLKEPYFGRSQVNMSFRGEEKALDSVSFASMNGWFREKIPTYSECRKQVEEIAKDVEKRTGVRMECTYEEEEEDAKISMQRLLEADKARKKKYSSVATCFLRYDGKGTGKGCDVLYCVSGMYDDKGTFGINVEYRRPFELVTGCNSYKPGDKIPVYTNETFSSFAKEMEEKHLKAHAAAAKLREVLKRTFATDFDETNKSARVCFDPADAFDWKPLDAAFEGATERRDSVPMSQARIPYRTFAVRRAYDGDVDEAELKAQSQRFLDRLEKELGAKVEKYEKSLSTELQREMAERGGTVTPTYGDWGILRGLDKRQFFFGRVGDVFVEICYLPSRYEKVGGKYELCLRGAVLMNFTQSPRAD